MKSPIRMDLLLMGSLALAGNLHSQTLHNWCTEGSPTVTLTGSNISGAGRIWNLTLLGINYWNYEGANYEVPLNDGYKGDFALSLESFGCSDHYNFYYTVAGTHAVDRNYIEQLASQLEIAWTAFDNQGFRTPSELKADGNYTTFTNFTRIPVLILNTYDGKSHGNGKPMINLIPGLSASSRTPHHELFHVIKHGYTTFNAGWLNEGLARWSEKFVAGASQPCGGLDGFTPATFNLLTKKYCDTARFFEYLGLKYGAAGAGSDGSDVVRAILEEMSDVNAQSTSERAMESLERAVDRFRGGVAARGQSYKEWVKGNYVDDTGGSATRRFTAPLRPRWKEAGEFGTGRDKYVWHDFAFNTRSRGSITIQIRAAAGDFVDNDGDDDDMRFLLDGNLLGDWNSANAIDGATQNGDIRTIHIIRRDVLTGAHTLRIEADEYPVLFAVNVFSGEVPLLMQDSDLSRLCALATLAGGLIWRPCFLQDGAAALLNSTFRIPAGGSRATVILEGRAWDEQQNLAAGYPEQGDDARVLLDGIPLSFFGSLSSLDGNTLDGNLAVELRTGLLAAGDHTLEIYARGRPVIDHVAVFATPQFLHLFRLQGGRLDPWSMNYHVVEVTQELLPTNQDVLAPGNLVIETGTCTWSHDLEGPIWYILLIDAAGNLVNTIQSEGQGMSQSITPRTLNSLGVGGRVVVAVGTTVPSGTYFVRVKR